MEWQLQKQSTLYTALGVSGVAYYIMFVLAVQEGWYSVFAIIWLVSPLNMWYYAGVYEQRSLRQLLNLRRGSWAFIIGDIVVLPGMAEAIAAAWRGDVPSTGWATSWWLMLVCALGGVLVSIVFHRLDRKRYVDYWAASALHSPTKLAHDFVAYPVLFGGLACTAIPVIAARGWWDSREILAWLGVWLLLGIADACREINPNDQHPLWDTARFRLAN